MKNKTRLYSFLNLSKVKLTFDYFFILVDKKGSDILYNKFPTIEIEEIDEKFVSQLTGHYDIIEINTAVKPKVFKYFLKKIQRQK